MPLKFYNSYTKRKENFKPPKGRIIKMYNCGPTVYDWAHIGNLRSFLFADILRRYLEYRGWRVRQVMNITDVGHMTADLDTGEDKMSLAMRREKKGPEAVARFYEEKFFEDMEALGTRRAWKYPRATGHIKEMINLAEALLRNKHAYKVCYPKQRDSKGAIAPGVRSAPFFGGEDNNGRCDVYYDLSTFSNYGKLSGNSVNDLIPGARAEVVHSKRNPYDFALWIYRPEHFLQWKSPWGRGYPGWHLECSAMAMKYLGPTLDIHTGGEDNKFPHHECEIAQSEGASGKQFARFWMHTRHLLVDGKKMSKSRGNFYTRRELLEKGYSARELRYALISAHYRETLNFTIKGLRDARLALARLDEIVEKLRDQGGEHGREIGRLAARARKNFSDAMDDDLNVPGALGALFRFSHEANRLISRPVRSKSKRAAGDALKFLREADQVLGLGFVFKTKTAVIPEEVKKLAQARAKARDNKDWQRADALRHQIAQKGYSVEDTENGFRLKAGV